MGKLSLKIQAVLQGHPAPKYRLRTQKNKVKRKSLENLKWSFLHFPPKNDGGGDTLASA